MTGPAKPVLWRERLADYARRRRQSLALGGPALRALIPLTEVVEFWSSEGLASMSRRARRRLLRQPRFFPEAHEQVRRFQSSTEYPVIHPMTSADGVSIVIPVLDNLALTMSCLRAIAENTPAGEFEVLIVDNNSARRTYEALTRVAGLRVIRNDRNRGFVEACNQGAAAARGKYLLFLNNDTVVLAGWLEALRGTLEGDPRNAAVGAMLIYPDGRLQEAGGIIYSDGSGWNYGKNDRPDAPEYNFLREVDYCSGACLMVNRTIFEQLGGFDRRFAPAYYEDTDLCFRLREGGYRVLYQPRARVFHFEGSTAGTDVATGLKQYQVLNRHKFVERHHDALSAQWAPSPGRLSAAADRRRGPHVVVVDHMVPRHREDSGSVRMTALLHILLDLGFRVTFVPDNLAPEEPYTSELQQQGVEVFYGPEQVIPYLERTMDTTDIAILCRAHFADKYLQTLLAPAERPFIVFDTVDLHYLREQRHAALTGDQQLAMQATHTREVELAIASRSDLTWVTSDYEASVLRAETVSSPVAVVPNIHHRRDAVPGSANRSGLLFIGGFQHPPNADAVAHLVRDILPLVWAELPDVKLTVVGSNVPLHIRALASARVDVRGFVEDVEPLFDAARMSVAPLRYGAGVKGKVSQSLALGLPVVTTAIGAEGMALIDGEHVLIGSSPEQFARQIVRLYRDDELWCTLSDNGRRHIDSHFGYDTVRQAVAGMLSGATRRSGGGSDDRSTPIDYSSGFYEVEQSGDRCWRWMGADGRVRLRNTSRPSVLHVDAVVPARTARHATVRLFVDNELVDEIPGEERIRRRYELSCEGRTGRSLELRIRIDRVFVPAEVEPGSTDRRALGLILHDLRWEPVAEAAEH